jgi:hypothetical protein
MILLENDRLVFRFPEVHPGANLAIEFQRTLRIPDDGREYALPPGLGRFPLRHVDDYAGRVPSRWRERGGVMLPMYQSEALWIDFEPEMLSDRGVDYPFAVKIAAGKINAVTGDAWSNPLQKDPQDYLVTSEQPWLDGYCVEKGVIRQFVAMPLGSGCSAEEQLSGRADHGGIQVLVRPMKREAFERHFPKSRRGRFYGGSKCMCCSEPDAIMEMGLAPGGTMHQEIYEDSFDFDDWDTEHAGRCFVHIANSEAWRAATGFEPPTRPPTAKEYTSRGLPWFDYYNEGASAVGGAAILKTLKSVVKKAGEERENVLLENESVTPAWVIRLRKNMEKNQVREWSE